MREYLEVLLLFIPMAVLCAGAYATAVDTGTGHTTTPDCYTESRGHHFDILVRRDSVRVTDMETGRTYLWTVRAGEGALMDSKL